MKCLGFAFAACLLAIELAHAEPAIEQIGVRGNHRIEADTIRLAVASKVGRPLEPKTLANDVRAIWKLAAFSDVHVVSEPGASGTIITFEVVERPTIRKILIAGNHELALDKINDVLDLRREEVVDYAAIYKNRDRIAELYTTRGFMFASVDVQLAQISAGEIDVQFTVDEHARVEVSDVTFVGNRAVSSDDLRARMATRRPGMLSFLNGSGVFRRDELDRDLAILTGYYLDRGFAIIKIGVPKLRLSRDHKRMNVTIQIDEGPRFAYGAIEVKGDLIGSPAHNLSLIRSRPGDTFARAARWASIAVEGISVRRCDSAQRPCGAVGDRTPDL